jgi:hypothetical protein
VFTGKTQIKQTNNILANKKTSLANTNKAKMNLKKINTSVVFLLLGLGGLHAQESTTASGGDATGSGATVAYSVGQVVYTTNASASGTVSQGAQQAYEIFTVGIQETELNISLSVFPNPTADNLTLRISDYNNEKLSYQLYDVRGKLFINGQITGQQTEINTVNLPSATYFIHVVNNKNKQVQLFKIIKNIESHFGSDP